MRQEKSVHDMFLERLDDVCREEGSEAGPASCEDQLAYMADMLQELRDMAESGGFAALSGFFEAARTEALRHKRSA